MYNNGMLKYAVRYVKRQYFAAHKYDVDTIHNATIGVGAGQGGTHHLAGFWLKRI